MNAAIIHQVLLGFVHLVAAASPASSGWVGAPMSWSPDGRWLSYTTTPEPTGAERRAGWLFEAARGAGDHRPGSEEAVGEYRIWASRRDGGASALLERSSWPLSSPRWHPRSRSLAFGRFVPDGGAAPGQEARGRLELVIRDGLDRARVLTALPGVSMDDQARARLPHEAPAWSPDGQFLAVPVPTRPGSIAVVRIESRRVIQTIENARLPSWSPDGTKLAFVREDEGGAFALHLAERQGRTFGSPRAVARLGRIAAPIGWGADGRSILAVVQMKRLRAAELDLVRIAPDSGESARIFSLVTEVQSRTSPVLGIAIDFDRDEELCFSSVDLQGRDADVCWSVPRDQLPYHRFYPIDPLLRIGSLAIAPDNHAVAMRFGTPGEGLSPPVVCELDTQHTPATEHTTLIVADESARRAWLDLLIRTSRTLLDVAMASAVLDGQPIPRPTVLPLPDEVAAIPPLRSRLAQMGRYGASLCGGDDRKAGEPSGRDLEDRLYFDYLRADYDAATANLEALEARESDRGRRLALLSLRAQILWARGENDRAREVAAYLVEVAGGPVHRIEETPAGRSMAPASDPTHAWARFLALRIAQPRPTAPLTSEPNPGGPDDPRIVDPFARFGPPGDPLPFAPDPQAERREAIRERLLELQRQIRLDAQRRGLQPPPAPGPVPDPPR